MKKWFFICLPLIVLILTFILPGAYGINTILFGTFLVWPIYLSRLPAELCGRYGESKIMAYIYPAAVLLLHEAVFFSITGRLGASVADIVTMLLPWTVFGAGLIIWHLISVKKHLVSLLPSVALFFVSALPSYTDAMMITVSTVFAYISISFITLILDKLEKSNPERAASTKKFTLFLAVMLVASMIMSVSGIK